MWIRASADLSENVFQLTTPVSSHAFVSGSAPTIIDTSICAVQERLLEEIDQRLTEGEGLSQILLTDALPTTVGCLPFLRQVYPDAKMFASPGVAERLNDDDYCMSLLKDNLDYAEAFGVEIDADPAEWKRALTVDQIVRDGDTIAFDDGTEIKVIGCPGFSDDGLAFLICPDGVLAPGEAGGAYGGRGKVLPSFAGGYQQYIESIDKLAGLDINAISLPHTGAVTGELAMRYLTQLREECAKLRERIQEHLSNGIIVEEVCDLLVPELLSEGLAPGGPFTNIVKNTVRGMVAVIAENK
ncbi:MAG: hypothetical protein KDD66_10125 [Bdellovibrionales bacterium]|nr:hypothetical protein [Bdellovibrionales bacterium]